MHSTTDRMRTVIGALTHFYNQRYEDLRGQHERFAEGFDPNLAEFGDGRVDAPYVAYINELSQGVDQVLAQLNVKIQPIPPGNIEEASDEVLMAGARMLKWVIAVSDATSGEYLGRFEWAIYRRHDRFAVPGPAQLSYLKARGGRTMMVG